MVWRTYRLVEVEGRSLKCPRSQNEEFGCQILTEGSFFSRIRKASIENNIKRTWPRFLTLKGGARISHRNTHRCVIRLIWRRGMTATDGRIKPGYFGPYFYLSWTTLGQPPQLRHRYWNTGLWGILLDVHRGENHSGIQFIASLSSLSPRFLQFTVAFKSPVLVKVGSHFGTQCGLTLREKTG